MRKIKKLLYDVRFLWWKERKENILMWLAWHIPRPIAYWVFVRMAGHTDLNPAEQTCGDVLQQHKDWVR